MASRKRSELLYPSVADVERFHDRIISQRGTSGYNSHGLIDIGLEWAKHTITYYFPSPGLLQRAGAMMYGYVMFHPYADGNKRTALLTTDFFFFLNHYTLVITEDAPEFVRDFYLSCIAENASAIEEIQKACSWLRKRLVPLPSGMTRGLIGLLLRTSQLDNVGWEFILESWLENTAKRFEAFTKKNGGPTTVSPSHQSKT